MHKDDSSHQRYYSHSKKKHILGLCASLTVAILCVPSGVVGNMQVNVQFYTIVKREKQNRRLTDRHIWCCFVLWCVWLLQEYKIHCRLSHCAYLLTQLFAILLIHFTPSFFFPCGI